MRKLFSALVLVSVIISAAAADAAPPGQFAELGHDITLRVVVPVGMAGLRLAEPNRYSLEAGAFPSGGLGLGLDFFSTHSVPVTLGLALEGSAATDETNHLNIAFLLGVGRYFFVGPMVKLQPDFASWYLVGGVDVLPLFLKASESPPAPAPETVPRS